MPALNFSFLVFAAMLAILSRPPLAKATKATLQGMRELERNKYSPPGGLLSPNFGNGYAYEYYNYDGATPSEYGYDYGYYGDEDDKTRYDSPYYYAYYYYDQYYYYPSGQSEEGDSGASYYNYNDGRDYKGGNYYYYYYPYDAEGTGADDGISDQNEESSEGDSEMAGKNKETSNDDSLYQRIGGECAATCVALDETTFGTCDTWVPYGFTCAVLESNYGCDCTSCVACASSSAGDASRDYQSGGGHKSSVESLGERGPDVGGAIWKPSFAAALVGLASVVFVSAVGLILWRRRAVRMEEEVSDLMHRARAKGLTTRIGERIHDGQRGIVCGDFEEDEEGGEPGTSGVVSRLGSLLGGKKKRGYDVVAMENDEDDFDREAGMESEQKCVEMASLNT